MAWLPGFLYRQPLVITGGASGAQTYFQIELAIAHVVAKMQADFDDLRFTQADGTTLVDAWLESKVDSTSAEVWVEFPTTPANTVESTYYMYYGNAGAASDWDIGATMVFGDDFEDGNYNGWTVGAGSFSVVGGQLHATGTNNQIIANQNIGVDHAFEARNRIAVDGDHSCDFRVGWHDANNFYRADMWLYQTDRFYLGRLTAGAWTWDHLTSENYGTGWQNIKVEWTDAFMKSYRNDVLKTSQTTDLISTSGDIQIGGNHSNSYTDWVFVRKFVANPPTYAFGAEEGVNQGRWRVNGGLAR